MNNLLSILFCIGLFLGGPLLGAQELVPSEPFLNRAPSYSQWTEIIQPSKNLRAGAAPVATNPKREIKEITVSKADGTRLEVYSWADGEKSERWFYKDLLLFQQPGQSDVYIKNSFQIQNMPVKGNDDLSQSDFPKLNWLSKETYQGVVTVGKAQCFHFQKIVPALVIPPPPGQKQAAQPAPPITIDAWIDVNTKLPVASDDGQRFTTYTFKEMPETPLELPPVFAKALENYH